VSVNQPLISLPEQQIKLSRIISEIDEIDAEERYRVEAEDNNPSSLPNSGSSSAEERPRRKLVSWKAGDPENPNNWSSVCVLISPFFFPKHCLYIYTGKESKDSLDRHVNCRQ
jgi:hypothetical protein